KRRIIPPGTRLQKLTRLFGRHRLAEIPALTDPAAEPNHRLVGILAFDPLDADRDRQCGRERGHRTNDGRALTFRAEVSDETAVDLDDVERQGADMGEG